MKQFNVGAPLLYRIQKSPRGKSRVVHRSRLWSYTAISIKVVPEQSGKVEYECEKLAGSDD